jgi:WW domain-containing oxidoreductase
MKATAESITAGVDLSGKTAIVTGSTSGIGREAARVLALRGATTVFACRNVSKGQKIVDELALPDEARARCLVRNCDLAALPTVRALVDAQQAPVDILLLNAGVFGGPFQLTADGLDYTYSSNYAGHFLLLHELGVRGLLSPSLRAIATLSENVRLNPFLRPDIEMLVDPTAKRHGRTASPNAKVLMLLAMLHLSRKAASIGLGGASFDSCDPGPTLTDNVNQVGPVLGAIAKAMAPILFKPVERGASVLVWAATSPELAGGSGRIFTSSLSPAKIPARWLEADGESCWRATEKKLGLSSWSV